MHELLGVSPGSVTVFAAMNDHGGRVTVAIDAALLEAEEVNCHPLTNAAITTLAASSLLTFLHSSGHPPLVVDLTQAAPGGAELE